MLIDAGHLANTNGGFIGKGLSMNAGAIRFTMGEFKPVNTNGMSLRENILPVPFPGPSTTLYTLLGTLIEAGKDVASIKDVLAGEQPQANVPATTVLALIEQGQKVFTAIYKRVHRALKSELRKLYRLNRIYLPDQKDFKVDEMWMQVSRDDYEKGAGVEPVSDPQMVSDMQQLGRAQYLMQFVNNPLIKQDELVKRLLKAAQIDKTSALMQDNPQPPPQIIQKGLELEIDGRRVAVEEHNAESMAMLRRAQSLQSLGIAIQALANADKAVEQQLRAAEIIFSAQQAAQGATADGTTGTAAGGDDGSGGGAPAGGGAGGPTPDAVGAANAALHGMAAPPSLASPNGLPHGLPAGAPAGAATAVGNRLNQLGPG